MNRRTDYVGEMPSTPISDTDIEALLTRREPSNAELLGLASALARIDLQRLEIDVEQRVGVFSLRAATLARQSGVSRDSVPWWRRLRSKLVTSALSVFAVIGMTGVAVASNAAAPGDLLYGIDQALERVGINDGGLAERLEEAATLADHGQPFEALDFAANAVSSQSQSTAAALERAAENLKDGQGASTEVAGLLDWMVSTYTTGADFGQDVAEKAQQIGKANADAESQDEVSDNQTDQQGDLGQGNNGVADNPGQSNNGNQPDNGNAGEDSDAGKNGNGPPAGSPPGRGGR